MEHVGTNCNRNASSKYVSLCQIKRDFIYLRTDGFYNIENSVHNSLDSLRYRIDKQLRTGRYWEI